MNSLAEDRKRKAAPKSKRRLASVRARSELEGHVHFRGRCDGFRIDCHGSMLTVRGRVPTFYLKRLLGRILRRVPGVSHVSNQVDVVCNHGLSSVRGSQDDEHD